MVQKNPQVLQNTTPGLMENLGLHVCYVMHNPETKPKNFPGLKFYNMQKIDNLDTPSQKNKTHRKLYGKHIP